MKRSQEEKRKEKKEKKNKEEGTEKLTKIEAKQTALLSNTFMKLYFLHS